MCPLSFFKLIAFLMEQRFLLFQVNQACYINTIILLAYFFLLFFLLPLLLQNWLHAQQHLCKRNHHQHYNDLHDITPNWVDQVQNENVANRIRFRRKTNCTTLQGAISDIMVFLFCEDKGTWCLFVRDTTNLCRILTLTRRTIANTHESQGFNLTTINQKK